MSHYTTEKAEHLVMFFICNDNLKINVLPSFLQCLLCKTALLWSCPERQDLQPQGEMG